MDVFEAGVAGAEAERDGDFEPLEERPVASDFLTVLLTLFLGGLDFIGYPRRG